MQLREMNINNIVNKQGDGWKKYKWSKIGIDKEFDEHGTFNICIYIFSNDLIHEFDSTSFQP